MSKFIWPATFTLLLLMVFLGDWETDRNPSALTERLELWFFDTSGSSAGLMTSVALWVGWRRLGTLPQNHARATSDKRPWKTASLLAMICIAAYVWSRLASATDLRWIALAALVGSMAARSAGIRGLAHFSVPIFILLLALPLPYPMSNEILWAMQNWSAEGTAALMNVLGVDLEQSGAHLSRGDVNFLVIEGCSGLRSVLTLTLIAFVVSELLHLKNGKVALLVAVAFPVAMLLNIFRIAAIVLSSKAGEASLDDTHLSQGLFVIAIGSAVIFAFASWMDSGDESTQNDAAPRSVDINQLPFKEGVGLLAILAATLIVVSPWPKSVQIATDSTDFSLPETLGSWSSRTLDLDYPFLGITPRGFIERREYVREATRKTRVDRIDTRPVEVQIARIAPQRPRHSPVSKKFALPGRRWELVSTERTFNYVLNRQLSVSVGTDSENRLLIYSWAANNEGFWTDSLRSLFALESGPFQRDRPITMIHIATLVGTEPEARLHAKHVLDRFTSDFRDPLRDL